MTPLSLHAGLPIIALYQCVFFTASILAAKFATSIARAIFWGFNLNLVYKIHR